MRAQIVYIKGHEGSETQANEALQSFKHYGWNVQLVEGITPKTFDDKKYDFKILKNSRLQDFKQYKTNVFYSKISCFTNHFIFWNKVVDENKPMIFLEHDAICVSPLQNIDFEEVLCLNMEYAFREPNVLVKVKSLRNYKTPKSNIPVDFPKNYPVLYRHNNIFQKSKIMPGTAAYAITPFAAKKLLEYVKEYGAEQSDHFINSYTVKLQYINPSPVKFNLSNLNTSWEIKE